MPKVERVKVYALNDETTDEDYEWISKQDTGVIREMLFNSKYDSKINRWNMSVPAQQQLGYNTANCVKCNNTRYTAEQKLYLG